MRLIILIAVTLAFFGMKTRQVNSSDDFKSKIENFISHYLSEFTKIEKKGDDEGDISTLDETRHQWSEHIILKSKTSFINLYKQKCYQRLYFAFYNYENEESCTMAIDSFLNCFPPWCEQVKRGEDVQGLHAIPGIYLMNKKEIIICNLRLEHVRDNWKQIQEDIIKSFANPDTKIITTQNGGPLEWKKK